MTDNKYKFTFETSNNNTLSIPLTEGKALFVLGANGVGKSTLMYTLFQQNLNHSKRILAQRQTWFEANSMNMTASQKATYDGYIKNSDSQINSRWKVDFSQERSNISIFDLINSENVRARKITNAVDIDNISLAKKLSNIQAPLQGINELLAISNIPIVITLEKDEQLFASKNGSLAYSVAELSDGERNALLICADVLTTEPNTLIILDEPERHLHRAIISPLLSSLFQKRKDCVFVISTHDVYLPIDHSEASVLLLRGCDWQDKAIKSWDADLIAESDEIPNSIKREILGAKRDILFVEGISESLDRQIYQLIFPNMTVVPLGSFTQVEKAVEGIRGSENLHWLNAFGLIDSDDRTQEQIQKLSEKGIAAIESYSVESLYYNLEIVKRIAHRYSEITGINETELYGKAIADIIKNVSQHKERLCSRLCEKQVRNRVMKSLPKHKNILERGNYEYKLNFNEILEKEESLFGNLISDNNLNGLISRYPVRETTVLSGIAAGLGLSREQYESSVRKLIIDDGETKEFYKSLLTGLTKLIEK